LSLTAEAPVITTDRADFSTNINNEAIDNLPINGRRWSSFRALDAWRVADGTFGLSSFRASRIAEQQHVDGGDNNQPFL